MNIGGIGYSGSGFNLRHTGMKARGSSASDTNSTVPKFDRSAPSATNNGANTLAQAALRNASQEVRDAWNATEEKSSGFNPLTDADGKIVGSSLLARYMEMEYSLMLRYGAKEARMRMDNVFADKESARTLIRAALERANDPLTSAKGSAQLESEKHFLASFLAHLD
ncbi:hypothetical protein [Paenibacillus sp. SYP-B4298]|uniref:hypothetical protein n=1 Tax=Paenibacillus sp. SYP-B4298 TaxID=2996034 RepID=UPI0022DD4CC1|nr:hypothetical protein [Paenibacillus sp. SYP-B4298]